MAYLINLLTPCSTSNLLLTAPRGLNSPISKHNRQSGFTLLELVVTLVLLGVLSATALPKFVNFSDAAKIASLEAVRGAFASGVSMAHTLAFINLENGSYPNSVLVDGVMVDINTSTGWPAVTQTGSNCNGVTASVFPWNLGIDLRFLMAMKRTIYNVITALLGVQTAFAGGGGGGGGGGTTCTLLRLLMTGDDINDWTQVIAGNSVTFTDSYGRSFVYNGATGDIN